MRKEKREKGREREKAEGRDQREEEEGIERKKGNRAGKRRGKAFVTKAETGSG